VSVGVQWVVVFAVITVRLYGLLPYGFHQTPLLRSGLDVIHGLVIRDSLGQVGSQIMYYGAPSGHFRAQLRSHFIFLTRVQYRLMLVAGIEI